MSTPNFRRGAPPEPKASTKDGSWPAKFPGACGYCGGAITEGERVRWNIEGTKVVHHRHQ